MLIARSDCVSPLSSRSSAIVSPGWNIRSRDIPVRLVAMIIANSSYLHISAFTIILILNLRNDNQPDIRGNKNGELDLAMMVFKPFWLTQTQRKEIGKRLSAASLSRCCLIFLTHSAGIFLPIFPKSRKIFSTF